MAAASPSSSVVAITGGAGGIGAALARRYAADGARVAVLDTDHDAAQSCAAGLRPTPGIGVRCDVTSLDDCESAVAKVLATWGRLDVLVNNAGITHLGRFADTEVEVIRRVIEVDLLGAINATKAALPHLVERRGRIVVVSSVAGVAPLATRTGYSAAKHGLHGFFDSLRAEHREDRLRVMLVCPSFVDTDIGAHALGADGSPAGPDTRTGVKDPARPEDIADAIVRAAARNRRLLLVPSEARTAYWVHRLMPTLYERLMVRRTRPAS